MDDDTWDMCTKDEAVVTEYETSLTEHTDIENCCCRRGDRRNDGGSDQGTPYRMASQQKKFV